MTRAARLTPRDKRIESQGVISVMRKFVFTASLLGVVLPAVVNAQPAPAPSTPSAPAATPAPADAPAAPAAAPAAPATPAAAPATPHPTEEPAAPRAAPLAWRGTIVFGTVSATINTFAPIQNFPTQACTVNTGVSSDLLSGLNPNPNPICSSGDSAQAYNPTVTGSIALRPRYFLSRDWQLRAGLTFNYEFTNSDTTTTMNEPRFSDPTLDLWFHGIPAFAGIKAQLAARVAFPLSPESRARTTIFTPTLVAQFSRPFEHVLGGDFLIVAGLNYSHPFMQYTTSETRTDFPYSRPCVSATDTTCRNQLSSTFAASDTLSWSVTLAQDWGWISPGVFFQGSHSWAYRSSYGSGDTPNVRQGSFFSFWVDFNINSWLTTEVGYQLFRSSVLDADGTLGNLFWAPYQDPQVYVQAVFTVDKIYQALRGGGGAGGVIRTENRVRPSRFAIF